MSNPGDKPNGNRTTDNSRVGRAINHELFPETSPMGKSLASRKKASLPETETDEDGSPIPGKYYVRKQEVIALATNPKTPEKEAQEGDEIDEDDKKAADNAEADASKKAAQIIMDTQKKMKSQAARDKLKESTKCKGQVKVIGQINSFAGQVCSLIKVPKETREDFKDKPKTVFAYARNLKYQCPDEVEALKRGALRGDDEGDDEWIAIQDNFIGTMTIVFNCDVAMATALILVYLTEDDMNKDLVQKVLDSLQASIRVSDEGREALIKLCETEGYPPENLLMQAPFKEEENFLSLDQTFNPEAYEEAWVKMMIPITATVSYTTKQGETTEEAWQRWYCRKGDKTHMRIQKQQQSTSSHRAEERSAWQELQEKYYAVDGHYQNMPNDSVRVDSFLNTVNAGILKLIEEELSDQEIARADVIFEIAGPMATNAENKIKKKEQYWSKQEDKSRIWRDQSRSPSRDRHRSSSVDRYDQRGRSPSRYTTRSRDDSADRYAGRNYSSSRDRTSSHGRNFDRGSSDRNYGGGN